MRRALAFAVFVLATIGIAIAAYQSYQARDAQVAATGGALVFPDLKGALNDSATLRGTSGQAPFTLRHKDGQWVVVERDDYRADQAKVKQMLLGLAELQRREPKTSKPERYGALGLQDPAAEGSKAMRVTVEDAAGKVMADLIIGDRRTSRGRPDAFEIYVRSPDDPQAWMVEGSLPSIVEPVDWLDEQLVDFEVKRVRWVEVTHGDGHVLRVTRSPGKEQGYALEGIPEGREVESYFTVRNVATGIANFPLDDVAMGATLDPAAKTAIRIVVQMYDGLRITMAGNKGDDTVTLALTASYEAEAAQHAAPEGETVAEGRPDDEIVRHDRDTVQAEVAELNGAWGRRLFVVDTWRIATADKRVTDFLKPLPEPAPVADTDGVAAPAAVETAPPLAPAAAGDGASPAASEAALPAPTAGTSD